MVFQVLKKGIRPQGNPCAQGTTSAAQSRQDSQFFALVACPVRVSGGRPTLIQLLTAS